MFSAPTSLQYLQRLIYTHNKEIWKISMNTWNKYKLNLHIKENNTMDCITLYTSIWGSAANDNLFIFFSNISFSLQNI